MIFLAKEYIRDMQAINVVSQVFQDIEKVASTKKTNMFATFSLTLSRLWSITSDGCSSEIGPLLGHC